MRAGPLRRRVELQRRIETRAGGGETVWTWETVETLWAEIAALSGRETFLAQQVASEATMRVRIRWCPHVKPKMRFVEWSADSPPEGTYFDIVTPLPDERRIWINCLCVVRDADGWRG